MTKKAEIIGLLVVESKDRTDSKLEKEVVDELRKASECIPWIKQVKEVRIVDS